MILRKPYAFLMKHFKKINLVLLFLAIYIFINTLTLLNYTSIFVNADTTVVVDIISLFSGVYFFVFILIFLITGIVLYLLKRKDKPVKTYLLVLIEYFAFFVLSIYLSSYFNDFWLNSYDKAFARTIHGFVLVFSLPQYAILLLLVIRCLGIDLNSFGFRQDKEFLTSEEDREEVEVEVGFDKEKFKRNVKKMFREVKYFLIEHKYQVSIIVIIIVIIISISTYRYFYVTNKVYQMEQIVSSNNYTFQVNNSYITTKDYRGDVLNNGKSYVILDLDIKNDYPISRVVDIEKFLLYVDDNYYTPTLKYNSRFSDLGSVYEKIPLEYNVLTNYFLIYEIPTPSIDSSFLLKYQDLTTNTNLIRIKLKIKDISSFILKDTKSFGEELAIPINEGETQKINITSYEVGTAFSYTYEACTYNDCPIYGGVTSPSQNRKILYLKVNPYENKTSTLLSTFVKYGKMRYVINGTTYEEKLKNHVTKNYKGNYFFLDVSSNVDNATSIEIVLTIRNNQYVYKLK